MFFVMIVSVKSIFHQTRILIHLRHKTSAQTDLFLYSLHMYAL